jgi:hypothetical protein
VTGKADGVAGVVRGVVHVIAAREARSGKQKKPEGKDQKAGQLTFANCCG